MQGLGRLLPKPILPLANVPALSWSLQGIRRARIDRALLVVGHQGSAVRAAIGDVTHDGLVVQYVLQEQQRGTGHALLLARDFVGDEPFLAMYGDVVCSRRYFELFAKSYSDWNVDGLMAVESVPDPWQGAVVCVEGDRIVRLVEKPPPGSVDSDLINAGLFVLPPEIFDILGMLPPTDRGEIELPCAIRALIERGRHIAPHRLVDFWINLTDPAAYLAADRHVLHEREASGEQAVSPAADIDEAARITRPVAIGPGSAVGRCHLGPDVTVAAGCSIADGAVLRRCILLDSVHIGPDAIVDNAIVAPHVVVAERGRVGGGSAAALALPEHQ